MGFAGAIFDYSGFDLVGYSKMNNYEESHNSLSVLDWFIIGILIVGLILSFLSVLYNGLPSYIEYR
jgi:hypothetical protein